MKNAHSSDYGPDEEAKEALAAYVPIFQMAEELRKKLAIARAEIETAFQSANGIDIETLATLDLALETARAQLNDYTRRVTLEGKRKKIFNGFISTRIIKRPGEYDEDALKGWVKKNGYLEAFRVTSKKELQRVVVSTLHRIDPTLTEVDEKLALKLAMTTNDRGEQVFDDAPVDIVDDVTQTSRDVFFKLLRSFEIEMAIEDKDSE